MSYARFLAGHGVYVCGDVEDGKLWCYGCRLIGGPGHHFSATKRSTMVAHLNKHAARRHRIGQSRRRLLREIKSHGNAYDARMVLG
jgi:hypothetical protein